MDNDLKNINTNDLDIFLNENNIKYKITYEEPHGNKVYFILFFFKIN